MTDRVLLVGATDGIGRALASRYLAEGWAVGVMGRTPEKLDHVTGELADARDTDAVLGVVCDVTDEKRVSKAFEQAIDELGGLDLMIYCAGVRVEGDTAEDRYAAAAEMLDVNLSGAIHFLELSAEYFAGPGGGSGRLAAIGSVAGDWSRPRDPSYGASKAGLHAYLDGLRMRLRDQDIRVTTIKPGSVNTRMLSGDPVGAIDPPDAARRIQAGLSAGREVLYVPRWWRLVSIGLQLLPRWLLRRLISY